MGPDRRRRRAVLAVAALAAASGLAFLVSDNHDNDGRSVAARSTTSTARLGRAETTTSAVVAEPTSPPTSPATAAAPARATTAAPATTATTVPRDCAPPAPGSDFDGFGAAVITIENTEGPHRSCVLTADTSERQQQGLMHQDDLDGYDGMIFRFPSAEERSFWMRNTSIPLTIAFFDAGGAFVSATDMEPCGDRPDCPSYPSHGAAKFALEVMRGRMAEAGGTPGSRLVS